MWGVDMSIQSGNPIANQDALLQTDSLAVAAKGLQRTVNELNAEQQTSSKESMLTEAEDFINLNAKATKELKPGKSEVIKKAEKVGLSVLVSKEEAGGAFDTFKKKPDNADWNLDRETVTTLTVELLDPATIRKTYEEIVYLITSRMTIGGRAPDPGQVDKVLEFLVEFAESRSTEAERTNHPNKDEFKEIHHKLDTLKDTYEDKYLDAIATSRQFLGLSVAMQKDIQIDQTQALKDIRELIVNNQEAMALINLYKSKGYTYNEMEKELKSILHYIGPQTKEISSEIKPEDRARLIILNQNGRKAQAILSLFREIKKGFMRAENYVTRLGLRFNN